MLSAIRGEVPDRLPWVPRLEFWYRSGVRRGALPPELRSMSLSEIVDRLGVGYHAVSPEMEACSSEHMIDHTLGILNAPSLTYEVVIEGVDRRVTRNGRETVFEYKTPVGSIHTSTALTDEALDAGSSAPWKTGYAIREPRDFEVVGYIFSHLRVTPRLDGYLARRERIGERGVAVAYVSGSACPMHHIMHELMSVEQFYCVLHDDPAAIERLAARMEPFYDAIRQAAADSPAEVIFLGGNYDDSITPPPFFSKYILPALHQYSGTVHVRGKYLLTHTDGENRKLLPLYREAGFDIADSVCPYPMTSCGLEEIREAFADRITIMGGIPSILLCPHSAGTQQFREFVDQAIERYTGQSHFVLGVSDMVTADAEWDRICYITEKVRRLKDGTLR